MNLSPFNSLHLYSSSPVDPLSSSVFVIHPLQLCTNLTSFWVSFPVRAIASVLMHHGQQTNSHGAVSSALRGFKKCLWNVAFTENPCLTVCSTKWFSSLTVVGKQHAFSEVRACTQHSSPWVSCSSCEMCDILLWISFPSVTSPHWRWL